LTRLAPTAEDGRAELETEGRVKTIVYVSSTRIPATVTSLDSMLTASSP
jgi:hypothetical protein